MFKLVPLRVRWKGFPVFSREFFVGELAKVEVPVRLREEELDRSRRDSIYEASACLWRGEAWARYVSSPSSYVVSAALKFETGTNLDCVELWRSYISPSLLVSLRFL